MWSQSVLSAALLLVLPSPELASPHLFPASTYPLGSLHHQPLHPVYYNGFYSPWNTFQPAVQAAVRQTPERIASFRNPTSAGCGTWTSKSWTDSNNNNWAGCYKYFVPGEKKSWEAAREQCRAEGFALGAGDADLAYFETTKEFDEVKGLITDEAWLRGKMETDGVKVIDNSIWTTLGNLPNGIFWEGVNEPVPDINTDRRLFITKSSKKLEIARGSYEKGFLCEFKKKACKDNTWVLDTDRCLKLFTDKKNWDDAKTDCEAAADAATLVKLAGRKTTKLEGLTNGIPGTWVSELATNDGSNNILFQYEDGTAPPPTTDNFGFAWAPSYGKLTTGTQRERIFLNSNTHLATSDGTTLANFVCQHPALGGDSEFAIKPLTRSLL